MKWQIKEMISYQKDTESVMTNMLTNEIYADGEIMGWVKAFKITRII